MRGPAPRPSTDGDRGSASGAGAPAASFAAIYDEHFPFVWRSLRRLGVAEASLDDAVQDVFVVAHRRLGDFEGRSSLKTWLFGIVLRVARDYRRSVSRKRRHGLVDGGDIETDAVADPSAPNPHEAAARAEAMRALHAVLEELDDDKREVFVMAELEQLAAPDIAEALGANLNTVYSRLRAARAQFEQAVVRHRARDGWRYR